MNTLVGVTKMIFIVLHVHACYSLFWTVFIYHTIVESLFGIAVGNTLNTALFTTDVFSDGLAYIAATLKGDAESY